MGELAAGALVLLILFVALAMIVGGRRGVQWLLGMLFAPGSCCLGSLARAALGILVIILIGYFVLHNLFHREQPPTTIEHPPAPDPHIAWKFDYPVGDPDTEGRRSGAGWFVSQDFADTANPLRDDLSGQHLGEDWLRDRNKRLNGSFAGEPVCSIANGQVIVAGANKSYGHVVMIRHSLPARSDLPYVVSLYGHISGEDLPAPGQWVSRGKVIGHIARRGENGVSITGEIWPEHLHFELRADSSRTGFPDDSVAVHGRIGYSTDQDGFLSPTDATSPGNNPGGGWIDAHR
jgi:murein DD-endopeptidase MepM/ murein hydrolase activator NlpD